MVREAKPIKRQANPVGQFLNLFSHIKEKYMAARKMTNVIAK